MTDRPPVPATLPPTPTLNKVRLDAIARDVSHEFLNELVALFLADVDQKLERLSDDIRERNLERALASAHTLKGAAASLGVVRFRVVAGKLEDFLERGDWRASDTTLVRLLREFAHVRSVLGPQDAAASP